MNTIVKALKGLYVKFGGSAADVKNVDTTAEMIDKVTTVASSGGGSSLPDMSGQSGKFLTNNGTAASWGEVSALPSMAEQSGKFLTNNGTTASWGNPSGGEFVVTIVAETVDDEIVYHTEHNGEPISIADIFAAKQTGKTVVAVVADAEMPLEYLCIMCTAQICLLTNTTNVETDIVIVDSFIGMVDDNEDTWTWNITYLPVIPNASSESNGKVLGVDDGAYAFVDAKNPLILTGAEGAGTAVTVSGATLAEIYEAANAGRYVAADIPLTALGGVTARLPLIIYNYDSTDEEYSFGFSMAIPVTSNGMLVTITLENSLTGEIEQKTWAVTG